MVVSDSSPLICLAQLGDFHFLRDIFGHIVIPAAVHCEVVEQASGYDEVETAMDDWISVKQIQGRSRAEQVRLAGRMDAGGAEAIVLTHELKADRLLMDDQRGVSFARELGLLVTRTPILYAEAKLRGWIPSVSEKLDALRKAGFWLKDRGYRVVLAKVGEL